METDDGILLGRGRHKLLMAINEYGSINKAAKSISMSYKKAWKLIDQLNENAPSPIVKKSTGGKGGGGTSVTPFGMSIINKFDIIDQKCKTFLDEQSVVFNNEINENKI